MIILIVVHLWLHWSWVCPVLSNVLGASRPKRIRRAIYGVTLSLIIRLTTVGSLLWVKTQAKYAYGEEQGHHGYGGAYETNGPAYITGRTTLSDAGFETYRRLCYHRRFVLDPTHYRKS